MKKGIVFLLLFLFFISLTACSKQKTIDSNPPKDVPVPQEINKQQETNEQPQKVEEVKVLLPPPKSFLKEADYNLPDGKVYYRGKAIVLTYHHISLKPVSSITVKPERFEADLKMLKDNYFNVVSFRDMINAVNGEEKLPPNAVVITFDDGYESFYNYAYPILKKYNMPAVNFIITAWTESYTPSGREFNLLSPEEIKEMYKSGLIDIQSHSHDGHLYITRDEKGQTGGKLAFQEYDKKTGKYESVESYSKRVVEDLEKSIPIIEKYTDKKPDTFCFPFGHFNTRLTELSKKAGFTYFVTTLYGDNKENSKNVMIKRIRSGDVGLTPEKLKINIINCSNGRPATQ